MPSLKNRLDRLDALIPKPVVPPPEVKEHDKRVDKLFALFRKLLLASWTQWTDEEHHAIIDAWEAYCTKSAGPLRHWLDSLDDGASRLPKLAPETMGPLIRAWLSPEVEDSKSKVCKQCGLFLPDKKEPPRDQWKLLPGKVFGSGDPPYFDWPRFFDKCPHCDAGWLDFSWHASVRDKDLPWMKLDGYAGRKPAWRPWHKQTKATGRVGR